MAIGRPKDELFLSDDERESLQRLVRRGKVAQRTALRARIVLACAGDGDNQSVARTLRVSPATIGKCQSGSFRTGRAACSTSRGTPRKVTDEQVEAVVVRTLESTPRGQTQLKESDVHVVMDNYGTHKTPMIRAWLAKRPRFKCTSPRPTRRG